MNHSVNSLLFESKDIRAIVNQGFIQEMTLLPLKQDIDLLALMSDEAEDIDSLMALIRFPDIHVERFSQRFEPMFSASAADFQDIFAELYDTTTQLMVDMVKHF